MFSPPLVYKEPGKGVGREDSTPSIRVVQDLGWLVSLIRCQQVLSVGGGGETLACGTREYCFEVLGSMSFTLIAREVNTFSSRPRIYFCTVDVNSLSLYDKLIKLFEAILNEKLMH